MAATVRWSFQLLPPDAQHLFVRLSVFAGGFDLEAAEAVVTGGGNRGGSGDSRGDGHRDVLAGLAALVDHSLVVADTPPSGRTRYHCLEPIRQCGAALLDASDDADEVRRRHAEHYLAVARRFDPWGLRRARPALPADRIEREEGNLLAALGWAANRPSDLALELCEALATFWEIGGRVNNGRLWMERLLARDARDAGLRASALAWAGRLAWRQGDYDGARRLLGESRALLSRHDDPSTPFTTGLVRRIEASVAFSGGDAEAAVRLCHESIDVARSVDDEIGLIWSHYTLGWAHYVLGDVASGDEQMWAALAANHRIRHPTATANARFGLHYGAFLAGDTAGQRAHLSGALAAAREPGAFLDQSEWLWCGAVLAAVEGRFASALRVVGGATALSRRHGSRQPEQIVAPMLAPFEATATEVSADDAARLHAEGGHMSWEELVAEVLGEPPIGGSPLTPQEREVTDLVARGLTNADIARKLAVPRRAVDSHIERVKQKLGVGTREQILTRVLAERRATHRP
jgi:non-specific serine/threonine protein kinase